MERNAVRSLGTLVIEPETARLFAASAVRNDPSDKLKSAVKENDSGLIPTPPPAAGSPPSSTPTVLRLDTCSCPMPPPMLEYLTLKPIANTWVYPLGGGAK